MLRQLIIFEAPHMIKRFGKYYLMFSDGKAIDATYKIGYAVGDSPMGPFTEGVNSPILTTTADSTTYGPGHHTVFSEKGHGLSFISPHLSTGGRICVKTVMFWIV